MRRKPRVFLDSNGLISAVITTRDRTPIYRLVMLGEQEVIDLRISREVISDVECFIHGYNSAMLPKMAAIIDQGRMAITPEPNEETIARCDALIGYRPDARILAAAVECDADVLVTFDSTHLLGNPKIKPPEVGVMVMNAQDCLEWCFAQWQSGH
ncbi:MAG: PIN domain-containing protein [Janthinobacterium lividum]